MGRYARRTRRGTAGIVAAVIMFAILLTVGKGSQKIDTGYLYVAGTTDTVEVITARGSAYKATYPPTSQNNAVSANTAQSLTIDPQTFKWTTIGTSPAALTQSKSLSNCNAAACALGFTSSVSAGDTLAYALGLYGQNPPSTPTDTVGSTFTLGASSSVVHANNPALVQNRYASNCNSSNCGLAFTSNVASGNVLAFGLGWSGQSPPSTPTDTRGDTFTLGASNSVTYTPPTPALVQQRFASNCNAANCGLAFTSNVAAGDILAYSLGWFSHNLPSTPTDTLGDSFTLGASTSVTSGFATPSIIQKGFASNCNAANCGLAYSSSVTAGNILAFGLGWYGQNAPSTPTDTRGNTFSLGASNSVTTTGSPSVVQKAYASNCNSSNCGLAFGSNVVSGNILAFGLGWSGQSAPSTPTDTRGNTFTLAASNSVVVGGGAPALVQM